MGAGEVHVDGQSLLIGERAYRALIRGLAACNAPEAKTASDKLALATRPGGGPSFNTDEARILVVGIDALAPPSDDQLRLGLGRLRDTLIVVAEPDEF